MFTSFALALVTLMPSVSFASDFFVKFYSSGSSGKLATAVVAFRSPQNVSCDVHMLNSGTGALTRVYNCLNVNNEEEIQIVAIKSAPSNSFEGVLTHSSAAGVAEIKLACAQDARGFLGCVTPEIP